MITIRNHIKKYVVASGAIPEERIAFSNAFSTDWDGEPYVSIDFDSSTTAQPFLNSGGDNYEDEFKIVTYSGSQEESERTGKIIGGYILQHVNEEADDDESLLSGIVENELYIDTLENESPGIDDDQALQSFTQHFKIYHCMR